MSKSREIYTGILIDENAIYTLLELCEICNVKPPFVVEMVEYGILQPEGEKLELWQFSEKQLEISKRALRLQRDLELDLAAVAVVEQLLEEMDELHAKIAQLEHQLQLLK